MITEKKFVNVGFVAHVDAGKTTITERLLYKTGRIKTAGSVDKGTTQTDSLDVERERGISVRLASASIEWNDKKINIIDTPGHVDFSAEVDRCLRALDCAVLVISAVEGIQAHTENIWQALRQLNIPTLIFINKIDRIGADCEKVLSEIGKELTQDLFILQSVKDEGTDAAKLTHSFFDFLESNDIALLPGELVEQVASLDDTLLEKYISDEIISGTEITEVIENSILDCNLFPVQFGSAKFKTGIAELLTSITQLMPAATGREEGNPTGVIYKIEHDHSLGKIASVRIFSGAVKTRDVIFNSRSKTENKVTQIKKIFSQKLEDVGIVTAGDTACLLGLEDARPGDILGQTNYQYEKTGLNEPLLTMKVSPKENSEYSKLVEAMHELAGEDPSLNLLWLKEERELHINLMGIIQLEIIENILQKRFGIEVRFSKPIVIYKETPAGSGEGFEEYTMPKPCWAVVKFLIQPGARGSGVVFDSQVGVNQIALKYQHEVERTIPKALAQGIYGWEITDIKISLIGGEDHVVHSRPGDFMLATPMALLNGLTTIGSQLLEPVLSFKISAPEEYCGKVISNLSVLRAEVGSPNIENSKFTIEGMIPVATSLDYSMLLNSMTGGKGKFISRFSGYKECPLDLGETISFRGISPLDRSKYILKHRGAIQ